MRDLEKQIAIWRKTITPALRPDAAEELEQHLREEIDRLLAGGAPAQDAFKQAVAKLGSRMHWRRSSTSLGHTCR